MLYLRWLETSRRFAHRAAILDGDGVTTFGGLAAAVESAPKALAPVVARSGDPRFFVDILRAWRDGMAVIPVERDAPDPVLRRPPPAATRLIKHTPGASGIPRAIFLNDMQVIADADRITAAMGLSPDVPNLAVVSLAHSYGFCNVVLPLLLHGVPARLLPLPFPRLVENAFRQHEAVVLPAVPSMWRAWQRAGVLTDSPLRLAISAGAPLALDLEQRVFEETGLKIHNFYGASECGGIAFDPTDTPRESASIVGIPLPGVTVDTGRDGRLRVTSDAVATGYDAPRGDDLLENGVYLTRDLGFTDAGGFIHLTGTTGGAINVAGRKISPAKVEAAIMATGQVLRVKVLGIPSADPERFEEIAALAELANGVSPAVLKSALTERLPLWEIPRQWRFGTQEWKLDAAELRQMFQPRKENGNHERDESSRKSKS
jgi:acyl-coenzyme A synthetase/AMP-(fatty) acid ligase